MPARRTEREAGWLGRISITVDRVLEALVLRLYGGRRHRTHPLGWLGTRGHERHRLGWRAERYAAVKLIRRGYWLLGCNVPAGDGEIDIIARNRGRLVFVEVRSRTEGAMMRPADTVRLKKQRQVIACAEAYMRENDLSAEKHGPRYDIAEVWLDQAGEPVEFNVVQDAFRRRPRPPRGPSVRTPGLRRGTGGGRWRPGG
jgi:putative endonuclease